MSNRNTGKAADERPAIQEYKRAHPEASLREISRIFGRSKTCVANALKAGGIDTSRPDNDSNSDAPSGLSEAVSPDEVRVHESGNKAAGTRVVSIISGEEVAIKTLPEALRFHEVDAATWRVTKWSTNDWTVVMRIGEHTVEDVERNKRGHKVSATKVKQHTPGRYKNFQVKVWLERVIPEPMETATENVIKRLQAAKSPRWPVLKYHKPKPSEERFMAELDLWDAHIAALAWGQEVGQDYDIDIARVRYEKAAEEALSFLVGFPGHIDRITHVFGQDFLHVNARIPLTPLNHNLMDIGTRFGKTLEVGFDCEKAVLERCLQVAPVHVVWIPGNHDPDSSLALAFALQKFFLQCKHITFDISPRLRKVVTFGPTAIAYAHGDQIRKRDLPLIAISEFRKEYGQCKYFEVHTGHLHVKKEVRILSCYTSDGGIIHRQVPGLCSTDFWHYEQGFIGNTPAAEEFVYSDKRGYVGHYEAKGN